MLDRVVLCCALPCCACKGFVHALDIAQVTMDKCHCCTVLRCAVLCDAVPCQGFVYALDVAQLMGDKMPACKTTDYEQWTVPADDRTPRCLLGERLTTHCCAQKRGWTSMCM